MNRDRKIKYLEEELALAISQLPVALSDSWHIAKMSKNPKWQFIDF